jgi:hypothetical protein
MHELIWIVSTPAFFMLSPRKAISDGEVLQHSLQCPKATSSNPSREWASKASFFAFMDEKQLIPEHVFDIL